MPAVVLHTAAFALLALASRQIGKFVSRFNLPYITGYIFAGAIAGPFVIGIMPAEATENLRYIDELSLGVIAFVAGSELYFKELRDRLDSILKNTIGIVLLSSVIMGVVVFFLTRYIPFTQDFSIPARIAVAILSSTVLLALSPASTIAVMQEVRARGPYSQMVLSTTVFMDVFIIILFAIAVAVVDVILGGSNLNIGFVGLLLIDILGGVLEGVIGGLLLRTVLSTDWGRIVKITLILLIGAGIFAFSFQLIELTDANAPITIHVEPILAAMVAGFFVTNFTNHRQQFEELLHDVGPYVYVAFFTLTGVALKLDVLIATLPIAAALFATRIGGIFIGSYAGTSLAGEPPKFRRLAWMGLITQAGIALGLAREVANEFPTLGDAFATMVISVVVLNEVFGPIFLRSALRQVGETHLPEDQKKRDERRDVVIFGIEAQSLALARELKSHDWHVILADINEEHVARTETNGFTVSVVEDLGPDTLSKVIDSETDAVVAMMEDDTHNKQIIQGAYERFGVPRLIARLNDINNADAVSEFKATVVDPASAMLSVLAQAVQTPDTAGLTLHQDPGFEIAQVTITNTDVNGLLVRDLRLPAEVLFLSVMRNGQRILPNGYTKLHVKDDVTIIGPPTDLEAVKLKLGY